MAVEAQFCPGNYMVPQDFKNSSGDGLNASLCFLPQHQIIDSLAHKQQREIDQYIINQYEELRLHIQEQRKRELASILDRMETKSRHVLTQKEDEIARARNRAAQLEQIIHKAQTEQQQWQKLALDRESQVIHLNNILQQMMHPSSLHQPTIVDANDDAESCCDVKCSAKNRVAGLCRGCGEREACVVLLPCRHLCSCVACELVIDSCPVCRCLKQGAIQALML